MIEESWSHGTSKESKVLGVLRRFIPGEYRAVSDINHPQLLELGLRFGLESSVLPNAAGCLGLYLGETLSSRHKLVGPVIGAGGAPVFMHDENMGPPSGASVFVAWSSDSPAHFVDKIQAVVKSSSGFMVIRPVRHTYIVLMQLNLLKGILKDGYNND